MIDLLKKLCQPDNESRAEALKAELEAKGVAYECMGNMAIVVPSRAESAVVLAAHFDVVPGSFGYNDNGMSLVAILSMLNVLPDCVEVVFTNGEERGFLGAQHYLQHCRKRLLGCVNLDVCGIGNMVYCDPMNSGLELPECKHGRMPLNDGVVFAEQDIPAVTLSTAPAEVPFQRGIQLIGSTIHNGPLDNNLEVINFELPQLVGKAARCAIGSFADAGYSMDA